MQTLCEVSLEEYLAADNPFDVVGRPEVCARCGRQDCFHRHGVYERYVEAGRRKVARFLCKLCGLTVSMLPSFVLPYRPRLVESVDEYFQAGDEQRPNFSGADTLRRYWRQWCGYFQRLQEQTGWPPQRPLPRQPREYWRQMGRAAGDMAAAQRQLTQLYGLSLLRRYPCHRVPACT